ncbi:MAG TPA: 5'-methylthioadenosine/S-adenosylhomocysteine nucleosidase [Polyangiales bacterium]|nr:5'-methylthioadenosine/S-adenosylhomocysteine nucleosidase [Polyangiales bacterium]
MNSIRALVALTLLLPTLASADVFKGPPRIGIVSAFGAEADLLIANTEHARSVTINGNRYTLGVLHGHRVVIVLSGVGIVNAAMTAQLLIDRFSIDRLIMSGIAGGIDPDRHVGDVLIPESWAQPLEVYWNGDGGVPVPCGAPGDLSCLGLQIATGEDVSLASSAPLPSVSLEGTTADGASCEVETGLYMRRTYVKSASAEEFRLLFPVDPAMYAVALTLKPTLQKCGTTADGSELCVSTQPALGLGGVGVSGSSFLANPTYREYLSTWLNAQAVDMETAALAQVARANGVPYLAVRSLSDLAGGDDFTDVGAFFGSGLAESNEAAVTFAFLDAWPGPRTRVH